jgi:hypothetical protein
VSFDKQTAALRAYAAASGPEKKPVSNDEVATVMSELVASSISLCNPFFSDAGLLVQEGRKFRPVDAVFDFQHAYQWNPETAGLKLHGVFADHWAAKSLLPKLAFRQLSKEEAIGFLAEESKATTGHRKNLETLLDFLSFAGVIRTDGNLVQKASSNAATDSKIAESAAPHPPQVSRSVGKQEEAPRHLDPMIQGLVQKLPATDAHWSIADRIKWLRTAANIFELVYTTEEDSSNEIEIKSKESTEKVQ